jgi:ArsR family transcriptional regulator
MRIRKDFESMPDEQIIEAAKISDALAHPGRIKIFRYIMKCNSERKPVRNKDIVADFEYSQATISQHLNKMIIAELIKIEQKGTSTYYYVNIGVIGKYIELLKIFE